MTALDQLKVLSTELSAQLSVIEERHGEVPENALRWRVTQLKNVSGNLWSDIKLGEQRAAPVLRAHVKELGAAFALALKCMEPGQLKKFEKAWAKHPANQGGQP